MCSSDLYLLITADLAPVRSAVRPTLRPSVRGELIGVGEEKYYVRGVTYGPFSTRPGAQPIPYGPREQNR